jgi:hypothetical protein
MQRYVPPDMDSAELVMLINFGVWTFTWAPIEIAAGPDSGPALPRVQLGRAGRELRHECPVHESTNLGCQFGILGLPSLASGRLFGTRLIAAVHPSKPIQARRTALADSFASAFEFPVHGRFGGPAGSRTPVRNGASMPFTCVVLGDAVSHVASTSRANIGCPISTDIVEVPLRAPGAFYVNPTQEVYHITRNSVKTICASNPPNRSLK